MELDEGGEVLVGEDVAVGHEEGVVDAGRAGREADGPGRVEGLRVDGVGQADARRVVVGERCEEGVGLVAE